MKRKALATAITAVALSPAGLSAESFFDKVSWVPGAGIQVKNLDFNLDRIAGGSGLTSASGEFDVDMLVLAVGLTAVYDRYYIALRREDSVDDALTNTTVPLTGGKSSIQREDTSLALGITMVDGLNVYVGYMAGETTIKNITGFRSTQSPRYTQKYREDGFFVGASYSLPIQNLGTMSLSAGYAFMDGAYDDNDALKFDYDGNADGLSVGATWSAPLTTRIGYYLDLRYQIYEFDGDDANGNAQYRNDDQSEVMHPARALLLIAATLWHV